MKIYPRASVLLVAGFALLASPAYAAPARPDLTVAKLQVAGQTVTATVKNAGPGKAKGSQVALSLSTDTKASKDDRVVTTAATTGPEALALMASAICCIVASAATATDIVLFESLADVIVSVPAVPPGSE